MRNRILRLAGTQLPMSEITIWHNPRCSKSRKTLELIREHGFEPNIVEYVKDAPTPADLDRALTTLGVAARDIVRTKEPPYRELSLDDASLSKGALLEALSAHPILIERPIVFRGDRAVIGRPPEAVLALLDR
ncbi:MAG: arsenate reductase (glutaredoxin) [Myxococcota bacterium]